MRASARALALGCGAVVMRADDGPTRDRLRDRIVHRYAGSALPAEVLLEERIADVNGNRLRLEVSARRTTADPTRLHDALARA